TVQFAVISLLLHGRNVLFSAETGSGKTIAYLAPIIQMIDQRKRLQAQLADATDHHHHHHHRRRPSALVILPSRELTQQVGWVAHQLTTNTEVGVATMVGGLPQHLTHT